MALLSTYTGPFGQKEAAHLSRRAGFVSKPSDVQALAAKGMAGAVDSMVDYAPVNSALDAKIAALPNDDSHIGRVKTPKILQHLSGQWLYRMVYTNTPLQEQFTLLMHDTLASGYQKVHDNIGTNVNNGSINTPGTVSDCTNGSLPVDYDRRNKLALKFISEQIELYRREGHLSYKDLVGKISRNTAMMLYLDNFLNLKGKAQENYGREIMELFTLGIGNYTETDVKEISRAFTGEGLNRRCSEDYPYTYEMDFAKHDTGVKTLFGQQFNYTHPGKDMDHAIDLLFARVSGMTSITPAHARVPATALFISWKFITWFVNESVPFNHPVVEELANVFRATSKNGYKWDVRETLRTLFKSQFFFDKAHYYNMYKHPADFMAGAMRSLEIQCDEITRISPLSMKLMGMELYDPPGVAGWDHGRSWVNSSALITRYNYGDHLSRRHIMSDAWCDALITQGHIGSWSDNAKIMEYFRARLIQESLRTQEISALNEFYSVIDIGRIGSHMDVHKYRDKVRGTVHLMMSLPRYQLK